MGEVSKAIEMYKKALEMKTGTNNDITYCNLVHCLQTVCDWDQLEPMFTQLKQIMDRQISANTLPSIHPHHCLIYPVSPKKQLALAKQFALQAEQLATAVGEVPYFKDGSFRCKCFETPLVNG